MITAVNQIFLSREDNPMSGRTHPFWIALGCIACNMALSLGLATLLSAQALEAAAPQKIIRSPERWQKVFQNEDSATFLDHRSLRSCDRVLGYSTLRTCGKVTQGYAFWKKVVLPAAPLHHRMVTGVVDCQRRELNFYPILPHSANEAIYNTLCRKP